MMNIDLTGYIYAYGVYTSGRRGKCHNCESIDEYSHCYVRGDKSVYLCSSCYEEYCKEKNLTK